MLQSVALWGIGALVGPHPSSQRRASLPLPNRFTDWVCGIISFQFSPQSSSRYPVPGIVPEAGCVQISPVPALKSSQYFNSLLESQCCVYLVKCHLPRSAPHELKCFKDAALSSWFCSICVPRGIGDLVDPCLGESKPGSTRCGHVATQMGHEDKVAALQVACISSL